ncbi:MAG: MBL fold metallo-hydrolase [Sphingomonas sp.]|nr:MAG: MBL fold metallo-hydrolase [Sphingomonas sp.]
MKRWLGLGALILLLAGFTAFLLRDRIALSLYQRGAERAMAADTIETLPDGLHAAFCGTGSPMPDPGRAGPCLAVIAGKRLIIVDAGEGAARNLGLMGLPAARIERVLLTHFHSDHIDGLGPLAMQRWVGAAATQPLILQGPVGVGELAAGFNAAYRQDSTYRTAHHGAALVPPSGFGFSPRAFALRDGRGVVLDEGGLKITAFDVRHDPVHPAVGYRFDYKGRCLTVSGDTAPSDAVVQMAKGCDLLVHEALQPRLTRVLVNAADGAGNKGLAQLLRDIEDYHTTPEQAAETAQKAGVKALALTHIVPPLRLPGLEGAFLGDAPDRFDGRLWIANDRDLVSLPAAGGMTQSTLGGTR